MFCERDVVISRPLFCALGEYHVLTDEMPALARSLEASKSGVGFQERLAWQMASASASEASKGQFSLTPRMSRTMAATCDFSALP